MGNALRNNQLTSLTQDVEDASIALWRNAKSIDCTNEDSLGCILSKVAATTCSLNLESREKATSGRPRSHTQRHSPSVPFREIQMKL